MNVVGTLRDDEIRREVSIKAIPDDDDEYDDVPIDLLITRNAALRYLQNLLVYFESIDVPQDTFSTLNSLQRAVQQNVRGTTQTKITSYFALSVPIHPFN